ncbi:hypothetical protein [Desulforamulus aquiferis]|uniref:Uncharacterized protein n=1 Tax=Desulforamulus aquiferis TaxID=1397668 RepID=A0AAW7ZFS7_9FIRM|nr:hypothetical protein [Desulforamulus aquiferis]MDO7787635.1 hypothetical protein [Desulforamulus aquiferis]RYD01864.1 hypothetical protein N752_28055 [Desulforamulus aquiferis]
MEQILKQILENQNQILKTLQHQGKKLDSLEKSQLRFETSIENEIIDKIRALFDAREITNEQLTKVIEKLDRIEVDTSYLANRVSTLEKLAK